MLLSTIDIFGKYLVCVLEASDTRQFILIGDEYFVQENITILEDSKADFVFNLRDAQARRAFLHNKSANGDA